MIRKSNKRNYARDGDDDDRNRNFHAVNVVVNGELSMVNVQNVLNDVSFRLPISDFSLTCDDTFHSLK